MVGVAQDACMEFTCDTFCTMRSRINVLCLCRMLTNICESGEGVLVMVVTCDGDLSQ